MICSATTQKGDRCSRECALGKSGSSGTSGKYCWQHKNTSNRKSSPRTDSQCKDFLREKIRKNMREFNAGKYSSRKQAIAVSYSQAKKASPKCERLFR